MGPEVKPGEQGGEGGAGGEGEEEIDEPRPMDELITATLPYGCLLYTSPSPRDS